MLLLLCLIHNRQWTVVWIIFLTLISSHTGELTQGFMSHVVKVQKVNPDNFYELSDTL